MSNNYRNKWKTDFLFYRLIFIYLARDAKVLPEIGASLPLCGYRRISQQRTKVFDSLSYKQTFCIQPASDGFITEPRYVPKRRKDFQKGMPDFQRSFFLPYPSISRFEWNVIRISIRDFSMGTVFLLEFFPTRRDDIFIDSIFPISLFNRDFDRWKYSRERCFENVLFLFKNTTLNNNGQRSAR